MDTNLNPDHTPSATAPIAAMLFPHWPATLPRLGEAGGAQQLLFACSPRSVCDELGLNWWSAVKLHEEGWLSFPPERISRLDEVQETELRFLGALVVAGCDRRMLVSVLDGTSRPYAYDLRRLYYDWAFRTWRVLPDPQAHPEANFNDWLELLVRNKDVESLRGILELAGDALTRVKTHGPQPEFYPS